MDKVEFLEKVVGKTFYSDLHQMYWHFKDENTLIQQRTISIRIEETTQGSIEIMSPGKLGIRNLGIILDDHSEIWANLRPDKKDVEMIREVQKKK